MFLQAKQVSEYLREKHGLNYAVSYIRWLFGMKKIPSQKIRGKRGIWAADLEIFLPKFLESNKKVCLSEAK